MTENNRPWDFNKIKIDINPEIKGMMNYNAKLRTDMSFMLSSSFRNIQNASLGLYRERLFNTASIMGESVLSSSKIMEDNKVSIAASAMVGKRLQELVEGIKPFPDGFTPFSGALASISEAAKLNHAASAQRLVESMKEARAYNLATTLAVARPSFSGITTATEVVTGNMSIADPIEIPREIIHKKLEEEAEKDQEEVSAEVPYNVLSMDFIIKIYLPCINMVYTLEKTEIIDTEFAISFFMSNVLPFICGLIVLNKGKETKEVNFDKDVIIKEE